MEVIKLQDIDIHDIGEAIQIGGVIWTDNKERSFVTLVPSQTIDDIPPLKFMPLTLPEWETLLKQTDILETEILSKDPTGKLVKVIYRKTQRQIDAQLQWDCFKRDHYHCRYCNREGIPLTVDHIDLWENGGATIIDNLITACRKCNRVRGNMEYGTWINSGLYKKLSVNLPEEIKLQNLSVLNDLPRLQTLRVYHVRSR